MRTATASDCSPHLWQALHLLDLSRVGENYVSMLVKQYGGANISTQRRNLKLPIEIWYMIVELLRGDRHEAGGRRKGDYCFVRASPLSTSNSNNGDENHNTDGNESSSGTSSQQQEQKTPTIVRCTRYNFNGELAEYETVAGHLRSAHAVDIEKFLASPDTFDKNDPEYTGNYSFDREDIDEIVPDFLSTEEVFYVTLPPAAPQQGGDEKKKNNSLTIPCLYTRVKVQDVIGFIDKGNCLACQSEREICSGCGGRAFKCFVVAGCDCAISCPFCIGEDLAEEYRCLNRRFEDLSEDEGREQNEELMERIGERKRMLGYL